MKRTGPETVPTDELRTSKRQEIEKDLGDEHHFDTNTCYSVIPRVQEKCVD